MIVPQPQPIGAVVPTRHPAPLQPGSPADGDRNHPDVPASEPAGGADSDPILCRHCGRTASNGISCEGTCVADSGY